VSENKLSSREDVLNRTFGNVPKEVCWYMDVFGDKPPRIGVVWYLRWLRFFREWSSKNE
jgi:hypothetical protein